VLTLELLAFVAAVGAGAFGALVGIGGGLIIVPLLSVVLGVDIHLAIAASLLGVIAVSTTASSSYLRVGLPDRRIGLALLVSTTLGGMVGGYVAGLLDARTLSVLFGAVLVAVSVQMLRSHGRPMAEVIDEPGRLEFDWSYVEPHTGREIVYRARRVWQGMIVSLLAGSLSGLLGIGGGVVNVPTMHVLMSMPIRVATTTSTYMLGATAVASSVLYFSRGEIDPSLAAPVVIGVVLGGLGSARLAHRLPQGALTLAFVVVALFFAVQMLLRALNAG
jgi:uncharacterized membrane protein YfcA